MAAILAGTATGLVSCGADGAGQARSLQGHDVGALAQASSGLWAVVDGREIGRVVEGFSPVASLADVWELEGRCLADTPAGLLVGTSEARLLRLPADGPLELVGAFDDAPGRDEWFTPWGGPPDTRSIAQDGGTTLVNVHVGGILRSGDGGATWEPTIDIDADVHQVVTGAGRVYAAGAAGLSVSEDGGDTWRLSVAGLHARYCRAVAVCGDALLLSASTGPRGGRAALYRSDLDGGAFDRCRVGLPEWFDGNLDSLCLDALPDGRLAAFGTETGELYASTDSGVSWSRVAAGLPAIRCVLTVA